VTDDRDISPDQGKAPPFAQPEPKLGAVGTGSGYSGQEYDSAGQAEWREGDKGLRVSPDGEAHGTGSPGEEIDPETAGSAENANAGATPDRGPEQE
jgi:hypothetical protein